MLKLILTLTMVAALIVPTVTLAEVERLNTENTGLKATVTSNVKTASGTNNSKTTSLINKIKAAAASKDGEQVVEINDGVMVVSRKRDVAMTTFVARLADLDAERINVSSETTIYLYTASKLKSVIIRHSWEGKASDSMSDYLNVWADTPDAAQILKPLLAELITQYQMVK